MRSRVARNGQGMQGWRNHRNTREKSDFSIRSVANGCSVCRTAFPSEDNPRLLPAACLVRAYYQQAGRKDRRLRFVLDICLLTSAWLRFAASVGVGNAAGQGEVVEKIWSELQDDCAG